MTLDSWNDLFNAASVVLIGVTFVLGLGALLTGREINKRQSSELVKLSTELAKAQTGLAEQQERAATAELRVIELSKTIDDERQARIKLDQRTANRYLEPEAINRLSNEMARFSGQPAEVVVFPVNFESVGIADLIHGILGNAKWKAGASAKRLNEPAQTPAPSGAVVPLMVQGVYVRASGDDASKTAGRALYDALSKTVASGVYDPTPLPGEPRVFVLVGDKPTPLSVWVRE